MKLELNPLEARVLGCLIEKEIATPEQYPLSLNALTNACNQKSNRDPVLDLDESTVQEVVDGLVRRYLISEQGGFGSRVAKYRHRFCNSEYGSLHFSPQELAIVCELFLRGAQTPGELRGRAGRLAHFDDANQVETTLQQLAVRDDGPFVARLPREPGKRESRYLHLLGDGNETQAVESAPPAETDRLAEIESRLTALEAELIALKQRLGDA
jgi:uncharacterized protein YceH (UPF0502 family)